MRRLALFAFLFALPIWAAEPIVRSENGKLVVSGLKGNDTLRVVVGEGTEEDSSPESEDEEDKFSDDEEDSFDQDEDEEAPDDGATAHTLCE